MKSTITEDYSKLLNVSNAWGHCSNAHGKYPCIHSIWTRKCSHPTSSCGDWISQCPNNMTAVAIKIPFGIGRGNQTHTWDLCSPLLFQGHHSAWALQACQGGSWSLLGLHVLSINTTRIVISPSLPQIWCVLWREAKFKHPGWLHRETMPLQKKKETRSRVCCHLLYRNHKRQSIISTSTKLQRYKIPTTMTQSQKIQYPMQFHGDFEPQVWLILLSTSATIPQLPAIFWWNIYILVYFSFRNFLKLAIFSLDSKCWDVVTHHQKKLSACCREPQPHQLVAWSSPIGSLHSSHWGWRWHNTVPIHKTLTLAQLLQTLQKFRNTFQRDPRGWCFYVPFFLRTSHWMDQPNCLQLMDKTNCLLLMEIFEKKRYLQNATKKKKAEMCPNTTNPI